MLHLLGGPPRCGKTTFATEAAPARGMGWLSTDTIRGVVNLHDRLYDPDDLFQPHGPEADRCSCPRSRRSRCFPRHVEQLRDDVERRAVFVGQSHVELADVLEHEGRNQWHRGIDDEDLAFGDFAGGYDEVTRRLF